MQIKNYEIVPYEHKLRQQLLIVWEQSVLATHHFLSPNDFKEIKTLVNNIDFFDFNVYCLKKGTTIVGFIGMAQRKVAMLFLDPQYIGEGWGRKLLTFAVEELDANEVDVNEQNDAAVKFYLKMGFKVYERTDKDDQGKNYPLLRMRLDGSIYQVDNFSHDQL